MEISGYRVSILGGRHFSSRSSNYLQGCSNCAVSPLSPQSSPCRCQPSTGIFGRLTDMIDFDYYRPAQGDYVSLCDGTNYKIQLKNRHASRCNATVTVDGQSIGTWRIEAWGQITIERPVNQAKQLTFFRIGSTGGQAAGLQAGNSDNGLVQVRFVPEQLLFKNTSLYFDSLPKRGSAFPLHEQSTRFLSTNSRSKGVSSYGSGPELESVTLGFDSDDAIPQMETQSFSTMRRDFEAGGTGLRGRSNQRFHEAEHMPTDESQAVTISLRLVATKCQEDHVVEPLRGLPKGNPIPPPL